MSMSVFVSGSIVPVCRVDLSVPHTPCLYASGLLVSLCIWQHFSLALETALSLCLFNSCLVQMYVWSCQCVPGWQSLGGQGDRGCVCVDWLSRGDCVFVHSLPPPASLATLGHVYSAPSRFLPALPGEGLTLPSVQPAVHRMFPRRCLRRHPLPSATLGSGPRRPGWRG